MKRIIVALFCTLFLAGCGTKLPPAFQNLKPVSVTVVNQDGPVENVVVSLMNDSIPGGIALNAKTDSSGIAKIKTALGEISRSGVGPGTYKVLLVRVINLPPELEEAKANLISLPPQKKNEISKKIEEFEKKNTLPEKYRSAKTTPLELTVDPASGAQMNIDLSKL